MGITEICVGFVICLIICMVSVILGSVLNWISVNDDSFGLYMSTILSSIGFGICLTYILYNNGLIS